MRVGLRPKHKSSLYQVSGNSTLWLTLLKSHNLTTEFYNENLVMVLMIEKSIFENSYENICININRDIMSDGMIEFYH